MSISNESTFDELAEETQLLKGTHYEKLLEKEEQEMEARLVALGTNRVTKKVVNIDDCRLVARNIVDNLVKSNKIIGSKNKIIAIAYFTKRIKSISENH